MNRLRKILFWAVAIFASLLALANRKFVTVNFDLVPPASEGWSIEAPLFLVILAAIFFGILLGGFAVWRNQRKSFLPAKDARLTGVNSQVTIAPHGAVDHPP